MNGQLRFLSEVGFDVVLLSSPGALLDATGEREGVRVEGVVMDRSISVRRDLRALAGLFAFLREERPDVCLVSTPKAALLAGVAALLARVPSRVYMVGGLRLESTRRPLRWLLWLTEWISVSVARDVLVVSPSLLARMRALHLLRPNQGVVLGQGASTGVDLNRFRPTVERTVGGQAMRRELGIPPEAFVFGFVGRLVIDKGVAELAEAFDRLSREDADAWLLLIGPTEGAGLPARVIDQLEANSRVRFTGWLRTPDVAYHAMDALVLPTYREGLPNVCLEAAAAGKPVITTTATGAIDSIKDGWTGRIIPPRRADALYRAMKDFVEGRVSAAALGENGRSFVAENFASEQVWARLAEFLQPANRSPNTRSQC